MTVKECVPNEQLRNARSLKGWSQAKLAEEVGTSFEMVSRWERGITMPSSYFRARLCAALGTTAEELGWVHGPGEPLASLVSPFVFLACSHADTEKAIVTQLKTVLQERGMALWSSHKIRRRGVEHLHKALRETIRAAQVVLLIVSPEARTSRHVREALEVVRMYRRPVCAVWIEGEHWQECLPAGEHELSVSIDARTRDDPSLFEEIATLLQQGWPGPGTTTASALEESEKSKERVPTSEPRNPYKGLQPFRQEDQHDFFGRDALIDELTSALAGALRTERPDQQSARLLAILGPSGSGKSSVVMAGLLPRLQQGGVPGSEEWIYLGPIVPGVHPIESLALALAERLPGRSLVTLCHDLEDDSARGLHRLAAALTQHQGTRVLLFVDQFEELFTQTSAQEERQQFIDLLVSALTEPRGPIMVVLTLRADFYDRVLSSALGLLIEQHHCAMHPMDIKELRTVIERPARLPDVQLTFEGDLVGDLLFELRGQVGALPLLQFTLDQLFQRRRGHQFTLEAYHEVGGVKGALARHAESTYASLPSEKHRRLARTLFLRLSEPGATEQESTRRRAACCELLLPDPEETVILGQVTEAFIRAHLLMSHTLTGIAVLEVTHEALIREWPRLDSWLHGAREDVRLQQMISQDAADWQQRGQPKDRLYRGSQLAETKAWVRRNSPSRNEMAFLRASTRDRIWYNISVLVIALLLISMAGLTIRLLPSDPTRVTTLQNDGPGSLRWVIENAPAGSTITFDTSLQGTLRLTSDNLHISKRLSIRGPGAGRLTISGGENDFGLHVLPAGSASISDLTLRASYIYNEGKTLTLSNSIVSGNTAANRDNGGAISNDGTLTLINSTVSGNSASRKGGGIYNDGTLTLINSTVSGNSASRRGGGIYNDGGTFTLISSTVSGNTALAAGGGGIYNDEGTFTLISSTVSGNTALAAGGGGISNDGGTLTLSNSTISTNTATTFGGGIANRGDKARTEITFCTIYGNTASQSGGGIWNGANNAARQLMMRNSLVAGNRAAQSPDIAGQLTSGGYNLIQNIEGTMFAPNQPHGTDLLKVAFTALKIDPVLKDNNRSTQTHDLLPGSLAIDRIPPNDCHVNGITTDQRGVRRPQGVACDIGAYELLG